MNSRASMSWVKSSVWFHCWKTHRSQANRKEDSLLTPVSIEVRVNPGGAPLIEGSRPIRISKTSSFRMGGPEGKDFCSLPTISNSKHRTVPSIEELQPMKALILMAEWATAKIWSINQLSRRAILNTWRVLSPLSCRVSTKRSSQWRISWLCCSGWRVKAKIGSWREMWLEISKIWITNVNWTESLWLLPGPKGIKTITNVNNLPLTSLTLASAPLGSHPTFMTSRIMTTLMTWIVLMSAPKMTVA